MPEPIVIGVDPGLDGAIAAVSLSGVGLWAEPLPTTAGRRRELDLPALARRVGLDRELIRLAVVERVASRPGQGVAGVFSFGQTYGGILGVLAALRVPTQLVTPQRWKAAILAGTGKDKAAAVAYACRRFPAVNLVPPRCRVAHDGMAEAICLAEFGRRRLAGESEGAA